ncbi:MAG: ribosome maturation factor RimP, partial [Clostridiales Family XIII bacterium]|nr:ribosome maturation factor RimP [Clostridiales Family XIII bacterium]
MAKKVSIYDRIDALLSEFLCEHGYELYHVTLTKEGKDRFLRVFIEKLDLTAGGISTDDCELVSRYLSERLDDDDVVGGDMYYLEVSSPGLDRELVKDAHFERYVGDGIELKLFKAYDGKKHIEA